MTRSPSPGRPRSRWVTQGPCHISQPPHILLGSVICQTLWEVVYSVCFSSWSGSHPIAGHRGCANIHGAGLPHPAQFCRAFPGISYTICRRRVADTIVALFAKCQPSSISSSAGSGRLTRLLNGRPCFLLSPPFSVQSRLQPPSATERISMGPSRHRGLSSGHMSVSRRGSSLCGPLGHTHSVAVDT